MKHFKQFLLAVLVALASGLPASAYDFEVDGIYYNILSLDDFTCEVTFKDYNYNSYSGDVVIPSTVPYSEETFTVTKIGDETFRKCGGLESLVIPESVTSIGYEAFYDCFNLWLIINFSSIDVFEHAHVDDMGGIVINNPVIDGDFYYYDEEKTQLALYRGDDEHVTIPASVIRICTSAFRYCKTMKSIEIPNSVTSIEQFAFYGCSLTSVEIPNSVTLIDYYVFYGCSLTSIKIPNSVTSIKKLAFEGCYSLTSITIGTGVKNIDNESFSECRNLSKIIMLPNTPPDGLADFFVKCQFCRGVDYIRFKRQL